MASSGDQMKQFAKLVAIAMVLVGCHKKEVAPPPPPTPESAQTAPAESGAPPPAPAPAPAQPYVSPPPAPTASAKLPPPPAYVSRNADNNVRQTVQGQVDGALTAALRAYVNRKGHMPGSFFEFTAGGLDSVPRPPEGKHWVIDASDTSVKAVPN
jgi:hypothetical protein